MADQEATSDVEHRKRKVIEDSGDQVGGNNEIQDDHIGPLLSEADGPRKSRRVEFEHIYVNHLPCSEAYEKSYMHRDVITHLLVTPQTGFLITASCDGHIKFWKKMPIGIEFVKHFRTHLGNIQDISCNSTGTLLCSISNDKSLKVFDVVNFDMINMMKLGFSPGKCEWIHSPGDPIAAVAVSEIDFPKIYIYDGKGEDKVLHTIEKLHAAPIVIMKYNPIYSVMVSVDKNGMLEYWSSPKYDYKFPEDRVNFDSKLDTDLYEFAKIKAVPHDIAFSERGVHFATISSDRKVRVFRFTTGKLIRVFDEGLQQLSSIQQMKQVLPNMEFGRRMAIERDLEKTDAFGHQRLAFDKSGYFIIYPTMIGVKIVNWYSNKCIGVLGKGENLRPLNVSLYQEIPNVSKASVSMEMQIAENPNLESAHPDPTMFCTAFKKNRFYIFTKRDPEESTKENIAVDRDVFNEKPSREDIISATDTPAVQRIYENCTIHTTMGDIHCKLFPKECPKTVENFCVHSKNGYYNNHIFHRIIKQFMIQTGDPTGTGTGGESIWGGEFEDEFHPSLRHDKPYCLSMANAGRNTNGSQFFITVIPCPWLDNKHTVFGRVVKGMEAAQNISTVKTHPKTDKPYEDIKIINISLF